MKPKIVIWGASGHARVILDILRIRQEYEIFGLLDDVNSWRWGQSVYEARILGGQEMLAALPDLGVETAIIGFGDCRARLEKAELLQSCGFRLATAIHPSAVIARDATIGHGTVVVAGAIVNPGSWIGDHVILNTAATIGHDTHIEEGVHIAPGVHLGGHVQVERGAWVGIGSIVKDHVRIGAHAILGAGSVVLNDVPPGVVVYGVPAQVIREVDL